MTCREFIEFLIHDDEHMWSEAQRASFEEHLAECPDCVHYLASYRSTIDLIRSLFRPSHEPFSTPVPEALVELILAQTGRAGS